MDFSKYISDKAQAIASEFDTLPRQYTADNIQMSEIMIPARDGIGLKTYIFYPNSLSGSLLPVLLQRSCYPHDMPVYKVCGREFAQRGYIYVISFSRGVGGSEGVWEPNVNERNDGIDTVNWLAKQPWCESIGFFGASYLALTGWAIIDAVPEKVKGMYLSVYGTNRFVSAYKDGLFRQDILTAWAMGNAGNTQGPITADRLLSFKYRPQIHVDTDLWGTELPWYRELITHPDFSDSYWQEGFWSILRNNPSKVKIPVVIEEGWYDHHLGSALSGYNEMEESVKKHCLLRIGAWKHGMEPALSGHLCQHLDNASILPVFYWFEQLLKKKEAPKYGVSLYVIGRDQWLAQEEWPKSNGCLKLYLDAKKYVLATETADTGHTEFIYDPDNPLPSHGAESCFSSSEAIGSLKQPEMNYREDVISFLSEPFTKDTLIVGQINADLYVSSDARDTSFSLKVMEVFEDGSAYNIRSGITTLAYREHSANRQDYVPDTVVKINIDTWDIAWEIKKGSRIRLDVSSSDFPQYSIHTNTPGIWSLQTKAKKARQTIYSGGKTPSVLNIPIIN